MWLLDVQCSAHMWLSVTGAWHYPATDTSVTIFLILRFSLLGFMSYFSLGKGCSSQEAYRCTAISSTPRGDLHYCEWWPYWLHFPTFHHGHCLALICHRTGSISLSSSFSSLGHYILPTMALLCAHLLVCFCHQWSPATPTGNRLWADQAFLSWALHLSKWPC
jgi:hypothetical protein